MNSHNQIIEHKEPLFDIRKADTSKFDTGLPPIGRTLNTKRWKGKTSEWFGGCTIAAQTKKFYKPAYRAVEKIFGIYIKILGIRLNEKYGREPPTRAEIRIQKLLKELNLMYWDKTDKCRSIVKKIIDEDDAVVIFEESGTTALSLIRNMIDLQDDDSILAFTGKDGGVLVPLALKGKNIRNHDSNFKPVIGLFNSHKDIPDEPFNHKKIGLEFIIPHKLDSENSNVDAYSEYLVKKVSELVNSKDNLRLIVVPQVTRSGLILPVQRIGKIIQAANKKRRNKIFYVVDAVQAMGRLGTQSLQKPLDYCDFYFFGASKALGAILTSSAIVTKPEIVKENIKNLLKSPFRSQIKFFQFPRGFKELEGYLEKQKYHAAISLPEICSFYTGMRLFYKRGYMDKSHEAFSIRREKQLERVEKYRKELLGELSKIPGINIREWGRIRENYVSAIINFSIDGKMYPDLNNPKLIHKLRYGNQRKAISPSVSSGDTIRLEIPEARRPPSIPTFINALKRILKEEEYQQELARKIADIDGVEIIKKKIEKGVRLPIISFGISRENYPNLEPNELKKQIQFGEHGMSIAVSNVDNAHIMVEVCEIKEYPSTQIFVDALKKVLRENRGR